MTAQVKSEGTQMAETVADCHEEEAFASIEDPIKHQKDDDDDDEEEVQIPRNPESPVKEKKSEEPASELEEPDSSLKVMEKSSSFREESDFLSDLKESEKKALADLKAKLEEAILDNKIFKKDEGNADRDVSLWGVPLLPSKNNDATNVLLLKFLRAREFKVKESFEMLQNTLRWRKETKIDSILNETELGKDYEAACYLDGYDHEGHPVCYNVSEVFVEDEEVYKKAFGSKEGRGKFLRWRVKMMERGIEKLDLRPGGVSKMLQIFDLKSSVGASKKELRITMKQAVQILQDNYPEFVAKNILVNVPFWYYAFSALFSPFLTQRTKSKFVLVRPANVTETLLKYIPLEAIPVQYGGFKRENDAEFSVEDGGGVSELILKSSSTETIEIPAPEVGTTILWDLTVLGWEVNYKEEFVPTDEGSYTIIVQKARKMGSQEGPVRNSFRNNETGKIALSVENKTFKKKKVLFRYKTNKSCCY